MADLDEDVTRLAYTQPDDSDLTDETQDFRFLTQLSLTTQQPSIPRRGEKDFEHHGTTSQQDALFKSRKAMHDTLSYPRVHAPKYNITATCRLSDGQAVVENPRGQHFRTMGRADASGRLHLLPEEALYLVERGNLDLRWPAGYHDESSEGMPFSLQSAYAVLMGKMGLTLERYTVYAGLRRSGYIVRRGPAWLSCNNSAEMSGNMPAIPSRRAFTWLYDFFYRQILGYPSTGSLVGLGPHRSYWSIYSRLAVVPFHNPTAPSMHVRPSEEQAARAIDSDHGDRMKDGHTHLQLRCSFHVWKPRPDFKKSSPGPPDFRIAVVNARKDDIPVLEQLDELWQSLPYDPPPPKMETQIYQKLKHGWRNVILAVVDQGVVSYLRVSDAGFGKEKLYERGSAARGAKRGGVRRRGRSGRGGGRGARAGTGGQG